MTKLKRILLLSILLLPLAWLARGQQGNFPPSTGSSGAGTLQMILYATTGQTVGLSSTTFFPVLVTQGNLSTFNCASYAPCAVTVPGACTLKALYVVTASAQSIGGSLVITLFHNGVTAGISATIPTSGAAGTYSGTGSNTVAAGDTLALQIVNNGTATSAGMTQIVMQCQ